MVEQWPPTVFSFGFGGRDLCLDALISAPRLDGLGIPFLSKPLGRNCLHITTNPDEYTPTKTQASELLPDIYVLCAHGVASQEATLCKQPSTR